VPRSIYEGARDMARDIARTAERLISRRQRKKIEMLFANLLYRASLDVRAQKIDRFATVPVRVGERLAVITFPGFDADIRRLPVCGVE
jgi:hypothetical protein